MFLTIRILWRRIWRGKNWYEKAVCEAYHPPFPHNENCLKFDILKIKG